MLQFSFQKYFVQVKKFSAICFTQSSSNESSWVTLHIAAVVFIHSKVLPLQKFILNNRHKVFDANAKPLWFDFTGLSSSSWIYIKFSFFSNWNAHFEIRFPAVRWLYVQTKLDLVKKCSWSLFFVRVFTVSAKLWQRAFCKGSLLCWRVWGSELCGDLLDGSVLGFRDLEENVDDE